MNVTNVELFLEHLVFLFFSLIALNFLQFKTTLMFEARMLSIKSSFLRAMVAIILNCIELA